eukprot:g15178.t1
MPPPLPSYAGLADPLDPGFAMGRGVGAGPPPLGPGPVPPGFGLYGMPGPPPGGFFHFPATGSFVADASVLSAGPKRKGSRNAGAQRAQTVRGRATSVRPAMSVDPRPLLGQIPGEAPLDCLVVGAGPVGLLLASELAYRGCKVAIIDALQQPVKQTKASGVVPRSLEVLPAEVERKLLHNGTMLKAMQILEKKDIRSWTCDPGEEPVLGAPFRVRLVDIDLEQQKEWITGDVDRNGFPVLRQPEVEDVLKVAKSRGLGANLSVKPGSVRWLTHFRINSHQAECYGRGRVFLAGDACHCHSPLGGQGMNMGFQDAKNLAWKLVLAIKCGGPTSSLLQSYESERKAPWIPCLAGKHINVFRKGLFWTSQGPTIPSSVVLLVDLTLTALPDDGKQAAVGHRACAGGREQPEPGSVLLAWPRTAIGEHPDLFAAIGFGLDRSAGLVVQEVLHLHGTLGTAHPHVLSDHQHLPCGRLPPAAEPASMAGHQASALSAAVLGGSPGRPLGRPPCSHLGVGPPARRPVSAQDVLLVGGRHLHQVLKKSRGFTLLLFEGSAPENEDMEKHLKNKMLSFKELQALSVSMKCQADKTNFVAMIDEVVLFPQGDVEARQGRMSTSFDNVPCLFLPFRHARFLFIYFHANAEDLGLSYSFCKILRDLFQVHVMAVEYPGYGDGIKLFGRSLGTAPTIQLATRVEVGGVILVSPFTSIKELFRHQLGRLADLLSDRFKNLDSTPKITSPTLIIHGQQDALVPLDRQALRGWTRNDTGTMAFQDYTFEDLELPEWVYPSPGTCLEAASKESSFFSAARHCARPCRHAKTSWEDTVVEPISHLKAMPMRPEARSAFGQKLQSDLEDEPTITLPLGTGTVPAVSSLDIDAAPEIPEELKPEVPKRASAPPQCAGGFFTRKRVPRWFGWRHMAVLPADLRDQPWAKRRGATVQSCLRPVASAGMDFVVAADSLLHLLLIAMWKSARLSTAANVLESVNSNDPAYRAARENRFRDFDLECQSPPHGAAAALRLRGKLRTRELVELRRLLEGDTRFSLLLDRHCKAVHELIDMKNPTPVLAVLAGLVWSSLSIAWELDTSHMPKARMKMELEELRRQLAKVLDDLSHARTRLLGRPTPTTHAGRSLRCGSRGGRIGAHAQRRGRPGRQREPATGLGATAHRQLPHRPGFRCRPEDPSGSKRELVSHREKLRRLENTEEIERLVYEEEPVMFYEPLNYLDDDTKMHVAEVIEEKLKLLLGRLQTPAPKDMKSFLAIPEDMQQPKQDPAPPQRPTRDEALDDLDEQAEQLAKRERELHIKEVQLKAQAEELLAKRQKVEGELSQRLEEAEARHAKTQMMLSEFKANFQQAQARAPSSTQQNFSKVHETRAMPATLRYMLDEAWCPSIGPVHRVRMEPASFLEAAAAAPPLAPARRRSSFMDALSVLRPKGLDEVQHTEYGEPFIGNTDAGEVPGVGAFQDLRALQKGGAEGFLKKKIKEAYDELEMNVTGADLDPYTDNAAQYAVDAKEAAFKATRAAKEAFVREAGLGGVPAKVDEAWKAAMQAVRMAHAQRLVVGQLAQTRADRQYIDAAVNKLLDRVEEAVETEDLTQQGVAVEAVKRGRVWRRMWWTNPGSPVLTQEAQKFPLYPSRDYVVAETPEPQDPAPPEALEERRVAHAKGRFSNRAGR